MRLHKKTKSSGWVNFPIKDKVYKDTREGGMYVKLVVLFPKKSKVSCCYGSDDFSLYCNELINDDENYLSRENVTKVMSRNNICYEDWEREEEKIKRREEKYFPRMHDEQDESIYGKWLSVPLLANILIGSTNWSGFDDELGEYWYCKVSDLTEEGMQLYKSLEKLYPNCEIRLLTFLDT
jgi:hypothetical protein